MWMSDVTFCPLQNPTIEINVFLFCKRLCNFMNHSLHIYAWVKPMNNESSSEDFEPYSFNFFSLIMNWMIFKYSYVYTWEKNLSTISKCREERKIREIDLRMKDSFHQGGQINVQSNENKTQSKKWNWKKPL